MATLKVTDYIALQWLNTLLRPGCTPKDLANGLSVSSLCEIFHNENKKLYKISISLQAPL